MAGEIPRACYFKKLVFALDIEPATFYFFKQSDVLILPVQILCVPDIENKNYVSNSK